MYCPGNSFNRKVWKMSFFFRWMDILVSFVDGIQIINVIWSGLLPDILYIYLYIYIYNIYKFLTCIENNGYVR